MSVNQLHTIELDANLLLEGVKSMPSVRMSVRHTFGAPRVQRCPRSGGHTLHLVSTFDGQTVGGVFTGAQLNQIAAVRDAGEPVVLQHHLGTFQVLIPPHALEGLTQVIDYADPGDDDWYTGSIPLITL